MAPWLWVVATMPEASARVLLARTGAGSGAALRRALKSGGFAVCAETITLEDVPALFTRHDPDLCLLDVEAGDEAVVVAERIVGEHPAARVVILSRSPSPEAFLAAMRAGA